MPFTLNKMNLGALIKAFNGDRLAKRIRKIERHGLDRVVGTFDA